jgi:hypothetical protein
MKKTEQKREKRNNKLDSPIYFKNLKESNSYLFPFYFRRYNKQTQSNVLVVSSTSSPQKDVHKCLNSGIESLGWFRNLR